MFSYVCRCESAADYNVEWTEGRKAFIINENSGVTFNCRSGEISGESSTMETETKQKCWASFESKLQPKWEQWIKWSNMKINIIETKFSFLLYYTIDSMRRSVSLSPTKCHFKNIRSATSLRFDTSTVDYWIHSIFASAIISFAFLDCLGINSWPHAFKI